ncbi:MAG TPA: DUF4097 family beta strand repeat-containing protein [Blastocatellia bacterium]|nr:DUF4097 family beta strand repeat-containing protein [Blastocatellia bacterium]
MIKRVFRFAAAVAICCGLAATAAAQDFQKSYIIGAGGQLRIANVSGDIIIKGYNGTSILVSGLKQGRDRDLVEVEDLSNANGVDLRVRYRECMSCNASVRFEVQVPNAIKYNFDRISTASGDIEVSSVTGELTIKTASGDVRVNDINGTVNASSASGDVRVGNAAGAVRASTASGDVDVEITRLEGVGRLEFSTASGDVSVRVPGSISAEVEMKTHSGELETDFPLEVRKQGHGPGRSARGRLGDGAISLSIRTASGDVRLKQL